MNLGMNRDDLVQSHKYQLNDAASVFTNSDDEDFRRHLVNAALDLGRVCPRKLRGSVTLVAAQPNYSVPATVLRVASSPWGTTELKNGKPWETDYVGRLPRPRLDGDADELELWLDPAPSARQIELLGATYPYVYLAAHEIGEEASGTSVRPEHRALLLMRAAAEACLELAFRGSKKPVQLRDGMQSAPRNGTPAALYEQIMEQFNSQARW